MASKRPADQSAAGKTPNQYIPSFITKKPFYVDESTSDADYLEHQRLQTSEERRRSEKWYDRGKKAGPAATKFRKGACENCGAMTHKTKDCLSRPRKAGARWTGRDIEADEIVEDVALGWDAKRDRWNGYDADEYKHVINEYNELEDLKKAARGNEDQQNEGERYEEETDMGRKQATSSKALRIREDTAKYLLDLDLDSARYDPKTRTMNDAGATGDAAAEYVAEQNFMRASGDAAEFENAQRYAWETQERGDKDKLHLQANPTSGEYSRRKLKEAADTKKAAQRKALVELYGKQDALPNQIAPVESETFVEYDERGRIKGQTKGTKSQYAEDIRINNHTSTWGSWWRNFVWGYACCHSTVKNSYCTGEEGLVALREEDEKAETLLIEGKTEAAESNGDQGADTKKRRLDDETDDNASSKRHQS